MKGMINLNQGVYLYLLTHLLLILVFLLGTFFLTTTTSAFRRLYKQGTKKHLSHLGSLFFYRPFQQLFFQKKEFEALFFSVILAKNILRLCFASSSCLFLLRLYYGAFPFLQSLLPNTMILLAASIALIFLSMFLGEVLPYSWSARHP